MIEAIPSNPYGSIYKLGFISNGRVLYNVVDSNGKNAGQLTLPVEDVDTFEKAYNDVIDSATKIQTYTLKNSSEEDKTRRKWISRGVVTSGGILGTAFSLFLTRHNPSVTRTVLGLVAGIVSGLSAGFIASMFITSPPHTLRFIKASRQISKLDIQKINK